MTSEEHSWLACGRCGSLLYRPRHVRALLVCSECDWHAPVDAPTRAEQLLDPESAQRLEIETLPSDPLGFVDRRPYPERLAEAARRSGLSEAVLCYRGTIQGRPLVLAVMDFRFLGGSLGTATGERLTLAAETALRDRVPLVIVTASGGARMQEGALSLMQMAKTSQALAELDEAGILTVSVLTDPTYGGVAASFASLADVIFAEPGARIGFAGPRVIEQTSGQPLPPDFQTAETQFRRGFVDDVLPRARLRAALGRLLAVGHRQPARPPTHRPASSSADVLVTDPSSLPERPAWESVQLARDRGRPTCLDFIAAGVEDFHELHGDRSTGDCPAIVGGLGRLVGLPIMVIGQQRGHTPTELMARNFGMPTPQGYRKAGRLMRLAAKLGVPVLTLIDTPGADPRPAAEQGGQAIAIAENLRLMASLPVPVLAVVMGEGGSGGALALGVADRVLLSANAIYSVISPEGCAAILWRRAAAAPDAAASLGLDAPALLRHRIIDGVIPEPEGGAHRDPDKAIQLLRTAITAVLAELMDDRPQERLSHRRARFRRFGAAEFQEVR